MHFKECINSWEGTIMRIKCLFTLPGGEKKDGFIMSIAFGRDRRV
jgi:hypothetical protein